MDLLVTTIHKLYGADEPLKLKKLELGILSTNYCVYAGTTKYFLKCYRYTEEAKIEEVHAVKKYFCNRSIPVVMPITTKEGKTFFELEGKFYTLFPFIENTHYVRQYIPAPALKSMAAMLARVHLAGKKTTLQVGAHYKDFSRDQFHEKLGGIDAVLKNKKGRDEFDTAALEMLELKQRLVDTNEDPVFMPHDHLVHGDYHDLNLFFDKDGKVTHVFDFEKAEMAPRIHEVLRSMDYVCFEGSFEPRNIQMAQMYLRAYHGIYPIGNEELRKGLKMYADRLATSLWMENSHYIQKDFRADKFYKKSFATVKFFSENLKQLTKELLRSFE